MTGSDEEDDIVFEEKEVKMTEDVGSMNVDKVEETGADGRESNIWLR